MAKRTSPWNAIRLSAGATREAKYYEIDAGPKNGRYIRVKDRPLNGIDETQIERSIKALDLTFYMPMERKLFIHHRTKAESIRAFPLVPGFAFVRDVQDYTKLEELKEVQEVIRCNHIPVVVPDKDIAELIATETEINVKFIMDMIKRRNGRKATTRRDLLSLYPPETVIEVTSGLAKGQTGIVKEVRSRKALKVWIEKFNRTVELPIAEIRAA